MKDTRVITEQQFQLVRDWLYQRSGIFLNASKKSLVTGRLHKRLIEVEARDFGDYLRLLQQPEFEQEAQLALNLLTTNETYFFREPKHFEFIEQLLSSGQLSKRARILSAAASSGEESYSLALTMAAHVGVHEPWQILGTDINTRVLQHAQHAIYPIADSSKIKSEWLKAFCVKGVRKDEGWFRIGPQVRQHVQFQQHNLMTPLETSQKFDLILLRNVLIYFELADKKQIVQHMINALKPGGFLLVGHSESIHGYDARLQQLKPACYQVLA